MAEKKEKVKEKGKGGGNGLKVIIIILMVVMIFGGGFGGYLIYNKISSAANATAATHTTTTAAAKESNVSPYTYSMDEFLVNLADEGGKRYFKVKLFLGYEAKKKADIDKELEEKKPILRDAINSVLRSKKTSDLEGEKIEGLKKEILAKINPYFEAGKITNIYFYDILIQ